MTTPRPDHPFLESLPDDPTLEASGQHKNEQDDQHEAKATGGSITPSFTVTPSRKGADEEQDEDDDENGSECHNSGF